jgi:hypothetical protein
MKLVRGLAFLVALAAAPAAASPPHKGDKDGLLTLYLLSVAADRCGFPITSKQADALDREAKALVEKMKLGSRENDAIYSEADLTFERQGPKACDRDSSFAKGFRQTLQKITGQ